MAKLNDTFTIISGATTVLTSGIGTAVKVAVADELSFAVTITTTGAGSSGVPTVVLQGTHAATSAGSYVTINSYTLSSGAGPVTYNVNVADNPYTFVRAYNTGMASGVSICNTGVTVTTKGNI